MLKSRGFSEISILQKATYLIRFSNRLGSIPLHRSKTNPISLSTCTRSEIPVFERKYFYIVIALLFFEKKSQSKRDLRTRSEKFVGNI